MYSNCHAQVNTHIHKSREACEAHMHKYTYMYILGGGAGGIC